jgi:hypothetical protein
MVKLDSGRAHLIFPYGVKSSTETLLRTVVLRRALVDTHATARKTQQLSL